MHLPLVDIVPATDPRELQSAIDEAWSFDWIVFTSVNGVDHFCRQMRQRKLDPRALGSAKLAAIGPATKKALEEQAFVCDLVPDTAASAHAGHMGPGPEIPPGVARSAARVHGEATAVGG